MRVITIRIQVPEGVEVAVGGDAADRPRYEPLGSPAATLLAERGLSELAAVGTRNGTATGICPAHRLAWRTVPAGISKKTGKTYDSFRVCPQSGCDERPR